MKKYMFRISLLCFVMLFFSCKGLFDLIDAIDAADIAADRSYRGKVFIQIPNELKADEYKLIERNLKSTAIDDEDSAEELDTDEKAVLKAKYQDNKFHTFLDSTDCVMKADIYPQMEHKPEITEVKYTLTLSYNDATKTPIMYEYTLRLEDKSMPKEEAIEFEFTEINGTRTLKAWCFGRVEHYI